MDNRMIYNLSLGSHQELADGADSDNLLSIYDAGTVAEEFV